jgi:capsular polysaccharide transport system permease protein
VVENWSAGIPATEAWADALRMQVRVIAALVRRETRAHFGESRLGYLWAIIEPASHLVIWLVLFVYIFRRRVPFGGSMPLFFLTGLVPYFLYYKVAMYLSGAVAGNRSLLNLPPIKPLDVLLARAILESATYVFVAVVLFFGLFLTGVDQAIPADFLALIAAVAAIVIFGTGLGMFNAVMMAFIPKWGFFFYTFFGPLYLLSGLFFLAEEVPPTYRHYLMYNPLFHYVSWFRTAFYPGFSHDYLDRGYALTWSISALTLGLALLRIARRKLLEPT